MQNNLQKNLGNIVLKNLIFNFPGICVSGDPEKVQGTHFCYSQPRVRTSPSLSGISKKVLEILGYDQEGVLNDPETLLYLSGNKIMPGSQPCCHRYCGFQFGSWEGQLGDGRAHTLGNVIHKGSIYELQLKGSGRTPFSRGSDGNTVLSSAVREFLASELMAGLKIPTTRALSLTTTQDKVVRDPLYNGVTKIQNAAVVMRACPTFLRFGSFHIPTSSNPNSNSSQERMKEMMRKRNYLTPMADYLIQNFYPDIDEEETDIYQELFRRIVIGSAQLVANWQSVGFVHGVLNTDNMSMIGVTMDYGPFGFMDYFSQDYLSNARDDNERYTYRQQPVAVRWNLQKLAESMDYLVPQSILKGHIEELFYPVFHQTYYKKMSAKLGLQNSQLSQQLVEGLLAVMNSCRSNFTNVFKILAYSSGENTLRDLLSESLPTSEYIKSIRIISNGSQISQATVKQIFSQDSGFNKSYLEEQQARKQMLSVLQHQSCQNRTTRQSQLWTTWLQKYLAADPDPELRKRNTIQYVLLNQVAKNITEQLLQLTPDEQQEHLGKVLEVFENPFHKNQWFQEKYWSKRPIPIRITCSS